MGSKHSTLHDLILHQMKDLFYAERHMAKMLPKMAKAAAAATLTAALEARHEQALVHVDRLEHCFEALDKKPHGIPCEAMDGIVAETKDFIHDFAGGPAIDAGLIGAAEAMDHYAVARYTALGRWAADSDLSEALAPLQATLAEARAALDRWAALGAAESVPAAAPMTLKDAALMGLG